MINPAFILGELSTFLEVTNEFNVEKIKTNSLDKWKTKLNDNQIKMIGEVIK
ncbi:MAG TPA: hypothetical protein VK021_09915 [Flavobacteriaceae bacterium]|nr:hypothetical protein [Flavobacteriaceae bacterium]